MNERPAHDPWRGEAKRDDAGGPLVLCVEDDPVNRKILTWGFESRNELLLACNDREACELVRRHGGRITCILMDIELRGSALDGIELARLFTGRPVATSLPEYAQGLAPLTTPLYFLTAYGDEYDTSTLYEAGAREVFRKPVDFSELYAAIPSEPTPA